MSTLKELSDANSAAADAFEAALGVTGEVAATPAVADPEPPPPAPGAVGTTPANDNGGTPEVQEVAGTGEEKPATPAPADKGGFDPQKTLEKYQTPEERDNALVESQRELLRRGEENARIKAELETLKAGKPPEEPKQPETLSYDDWLKKVHATTDPSTLTEQERNVKQAISELSVEKAALKKNQAAIEETKGKVSAVQTKISRLQTVIEANEADFKANPDDFGLEQRLMARRAELKELRDESRDLRQDVFDQEKEFEHKQSAYRQNVLDLDAYGQGYVSRLQRQTHQAATADADSAALNNEWKTGSDALFETDLKDFTPTERVVALQFLVNKLNDHVQSTGEAPEDLAAWQRGQTEVFDQVRKLRVETQQALVKQKRSDMPSKPLDNVVKDTPVSSGKTPLSAFNDTMKKAGASIDKMFA